MKKNIEPANPSHLVKSQSGIINGVQIGSGDIVKIKGESGDFRIDAFVVNPNNGAKWVDCFELEAGRARSHRSFMEERIGPPKRKNGKQGTGPSDGSHGEGKRRSRAVSPRQK